MWEHIDEQKDLLFHVAREIHAHPETRYKEFFAVETFCKALETAGLKNIERNTGGLETSFQVKIGRSGGPRVAILAEYDALPE